MPLNIYTSNRMENLVDACAGVLEKPLPSPFVKETIVVQSKGMQRWLAMELAKRFGVWANCDYPFPNLLVWRLFRAVWPDIPDTSPFSPDVLAWRVMGILPPLLERAACAPLKHYLASDRNGLKLFQLAERIADTFDQYTLFRPELLRDWETGPGGDWQGLLWRQLTASGTERHRGVLREEFCRQLRGEAQDRGAIPERIAVFGISYLPAYHLEVLAASARVTEINLFLLSPTREYWGDIVSPREKTRLTPEECSLRIEGNPLLASLGRLGRDFSDMVIEAGDTALSREDIYDDPGSATLLRSIQSDILNLRSAEEGEARRIAGNDRSVQIHSCHSPLREMEVLHDNLLALLESVEGLAPRDIVVMTPDIETYAPFIATVFEEGRESARKIPYSIADRSIATEGKIAAALLKLLELPGSRLTVPSVLDILEMPPVMERFGLEGDQLEAIRGWLVETRVRWGMDERDRSRLGLPAYRENSWRAGLDRLFLGYAMPDEGGSIFNGILPYDDMEGSAPLALGKLADFLERIGEIAASLPRQRPLGEWRQTLRKMLADFVAADDDATRELATVAELVETLGDMERAAGYGRPVDLAVVRAWLSACLGREEKGLGFMTGGVTFCAMLPMRSIPFRVVALVGMNDGAFPRQARPPGFDLIARNPRRGDRSIRDEDRYLFLESILSARDTLYVSYVGQSIRDNAEIPPSVLVSEFIDAVDRGYSAGEGVSAEERLVTKHRLQAFSRAYFDGGSTLFSYSEENCAALLHRRAEPWEAAEFLRTPLAPPAAEWLDIPLARLLRFFDNPARFFVVNRLGIRIEDAAAPLEEREPFGVDGLTAYGLKQELLEIILAGGEPRELLPVARCRGILPPARHGEAVFAAAVEEAAAFSAKIAGKIAGNPPLAPLDFSLVVGDCRLSGRLDRIWPGRMIRYRCARMKALDQVRSWIEHLVLNAIRREGYPRETELLMADGSRTYAGVEDPAGVLATLLDLYREGLTAPLRFFPASAMEYGRKQEWDLERARKKWADGYAFAGEGDDPYFRLCFGGTDPFTADFERVAQALLAPLLRHMS